MHSGIKPPTVDSARFIFFDVESLDNVFTVAFYEAAHGNRPPCLEVYVLTEQPQPGQKPDPIHALMSGSFNTQRAAREVCEKNPSVDAHPEHVHFYHLNSSPGVAISLMKKFGVSTCDDIHVLGDPKNTQKNSHRFIKETPADTDPNYDPTVHPFYAGYNSANYDLTILSLLFSALSESFSEQRYQDFENRAEIESRHSGESFSECIKRIVSQYYFTHLPSPQSLREDNNEMFSKYINNMTEILRPGTDAFAIRRNIIRSGRHIDVSKFNEVQQKVGLKRQLGTLGLHIMESDKLSGTQTRIDSPEDFYDLLAYNCSDVIGLKYLLDDPVYAGGFNLKAALLYEYPETVYEQDMNSGQNGEPVTPKVSPSTVRFNRLVIDDTSAKFVGRVLAPYEPLDDIPSVSFMYPDPQIAAELGVQSVDVLDEARKFFFSHVSDPAARADFDRVYASYGALRGKNVNSSVRHNKRNDVSSMPISFIQSDGSSRSNNIDTQFFDVKAVNIPYYRTDGSPSRSYVTFSTGGIHGAQFNPDLCDHDNRDIDDFNTVVAQAAATWPNPLDVWGKEITSPRGVVYTHTKLLKTGSTKTKLTELSQLSHIHPDERTEQQQNRWKKLASSVGYRDLKPRKEVFPISDKGVEKLNNRYAITSIAPHCFHEDFTSYYPNLLRNMRAFYNPQLGQDRYAKIFFQKEEYSRLRKDPSITQDQRRLYNTLREGTKLILNSATGVGATPYDNPIRMNNRILSMRLIGQILTWRIGQAQVFAGAEIPSTNTDGLYSAGLDETTNNAVLAREAAAINVDIEPEAMRLVSKDANNRAEISPAGEVIGTGGSSLAAFAHPLLTKTSTVPSITDRILGVYLAQLLDEPDGVSIFSPFDRVRARKIYDQEVAKMSMFEHVRHMQHIVAASRGMYRYTFTITPHPDGREVHPEEIHAHQDVYQPTPLQHYNRIFFVKQGAPEAVCVRSAIAKKISTTSAKSRKKKGVQSVFDDPVALDILAYHGVLRHEVRDASAQVIPADRECAVMKLPHINLNTPVMVCNEDLMSMSEDRMKEIIDSLNIDYYIDIVENDYEKNWRNISVPKD